MSNICFDEQTMDMCEAYEDLSLRVFRFARLKLHGSYDNGIAAFRVRVLLYVRRLYMSGDTNF